MKILLLSLLRRKVSKEITASRPRFIFDLATHLLKKGHEVTIMGTGDSKVDGAKIISIIPQSINNLPPFENTFYAETAFLVEMAMKLKEVESQFDIIHNHTFPEFVNLLAAEQIQVPMVTTIHAPVTPELDHALSLFPKAYLVSPSNLHKSTLKETVVSKVIPHGTDTNLYTYCENPSGDYLLWMGRLGLAKDSSGNFIDGKGVRTAIKVAKQTGKKLYLTANVENNEFYERDVKPYLSDDIKWIGAVSNEQPLSKQEVAEYMQNAKALLITTRFDESFGLTAIEAMSCGTPVIGVKKGVIPEIVIDGENGYTSDEDELPDVINKLYSLSNSEYLMMRKAARTQIEKNYSLEKMAENYIQFYQSILSKKTT